jgi:hypothetical protein
MQRGKCNECKKNVLAKEVKTINHFAHIFLVVITAGIWLLPWLYIAAVSKPNYVCSTCGSALVPIKTPGFDEPPLIEQIFGWIAFFVICLVGYLLYPSYKSGALSMPLYLTIIYSVIMIYYTLKATVPGFMKSKRDGLVAVYVYLSNFILWGLAIASLGLFAMGNEYATFIACLIPFIFSTFFISAQNTTDVFDLEYESLIKGNVVGLVVMFIGMFLTMTIMMLSGLGYAFFDLSIWKGILIGLTPTFFFFLSIVVSTFVR